MYGSVFSCVLLLQTCALIYTKDLKDSNSNESCEGQRPRTQNGTCPLLPGDKCGEEPDSVCDEEIGYTCIEGLCRGEYNLSLSDVKPTTATVTWSAFLPEGSNYEYSVLYTTDMTQSLTRWNNHGVGDITHVTLRYLTADTLYFVRIGVWTLQQKFDNLTEVVFLKTQAVNHCLYNGRPIKVDEALVVECEESCVCRSTGRFECVPVCHKGDTETPVCTDEQTDMCCDSISHCLFKGSEDKSCIKTITMLPAGYLKSSCQLWGNREPGLTMRNPEVLSPHFLYYNCTYLGDTVPHGKTWIIDCQENCTCLDGIVMCTPLCEHVPEPENCASTVRVKSPDGCCDVWRCEQHEKVCSFRNKTFSEGTWFEDDCEICTCHPLTGNVECIDLQLCETPDVPETSDACRTPTIINNLCCSQVYCEHNQSLDDFLETFSVSPYHSDAIIVRFKLTSATNEDDVSSVNLAFTTQPFKRSPSVWENITFFLSDAEDVTNSSVEYSRLGEHNTLYRVVDSYIIMLTQLETNVFHYVRLQLEIYGADQNENNETVKTLVSNMVVVKLHGAPMKRPQGLLSTGNKRPVRTFSLRAVNISSVSAVVTWSVPTIQQNNISSFSVKYKRLSAHEWHETERLIFTERNTQLSCLYDSHWYHIELWAYPGERRLGTAFFNTSGVIESQDTNFHLKIKHIEIGSHKVKIGWEPINDKYLKHVTTLEVLWSGNHNNEAVSKLCFAARTSKYTIDNLIPGKLYLSWIRVNLDNGKSVLSNRIHFVTTTVHVAGSSHSHTSRQHSIVLAITVSIASLISIAIAIATIAYLTRCRKRASYQSQTSFENKIFQIYTNREDREVLT